MCVRAIPSTINKSAVAAPAGESICVPREPQQLGRKQRLRAEAHKNRRPCERGRGRKKREGGGVCTRVKLRRAAAG